jgi:murein DD-endopeptidase MepM/ murein hydrolase activator NlpD
MAKKVWNVVLVPEGEGVVHSLRIPARLLYGAAAVLALGLLLVLGSVTLHFWSLRGLHSAQALRQENASLRSHLSTVNSALDRMEGMVREGEQMERQARMLAGLDAVDDQTRQLGVGGPLLGAPQQVVPGDPRVSRTVEDQKQKLDQLTRQATFQRQSLLETLDRLKDLGDKLGHTPSICPLRDQYVISAGFGWRADPFTNQRAFHTGLDLRAETGTPVHATAAGEVVFVGYDGEFGQCVRIRHGYGYETSYCHLSAAMVAQGQAVVRGMVIGKVGSSGRSTGPHLHYEVWINGVARDPSDHILTPRSVAD